MSRPSSRNCEQPLRLSSSEIERSAHQIVLRKPFELELPAPLFRAIYHCGVIDPAALASQSDSPLLETVCMVHL